jgi:hypothetical protein
MKVKIAILALVFVAGCGQTYRSTLITPQKISGTPKIKIEPIACNNPGGKAILEESLKQEFRKKGYIITDSNSDVVISGSATISDNPWEYLTPAVVMAVIYFQDNNGLSYGSIKSKTGWAASESPERFAKIIAKKISEKLQNKP